MSKGTYTICPHCGARYNDPPEKADGKSAACRQCGRRFKIQIMADDGRTVVLEGDKPAQAAPIAPGPPAPPPTARLESFVDPFDESRRPRIREWNKGDLILKIYKVAGLLGQGGMGRVYLVRHLGWRMNLAVKVPTPEILAAKGGADEFQSEAENWVNLGLHPHVVSCHYVRRVEESPCVFAEFASGGSLHDWIYGPKGDLGRLYENGEAETASRILDIGIQAAWGLQYAHDKGLVHRDVKPANIMMTPQGVAKITDFGLAVSQSPDAQDHAPDVSREPTVPAGVVGTPQYYAPEQAVGGAVNAAADQWSWALCLVEMFKGGRTWESGTVGQSALREMVDSGRTDHKLPALPESAAEIMFKALEPFPEDRFPRLGDAAEALMAVYAGVVGREYPRRQPQAAHMTAPSLNNRALSLFDIGRTDEAFRLWERVGTEHPHHPESTYNHGLAAWRASLGDDSTLLAAAAESRASHPGEGLPLLAEAFVHLERDDPARAVGLLKKLPGEMKDSWEAREARAVIKSRGAKSNRKCKAYQGHEGPVNAAALSADGKFLLSAGEDGLAVVRRTADGQVIASRRQGPVPLNCAVFVGNHSLAALGGGSFTQPVYDVTLWSPQVEGQEVSLKKHGHKIISLTANQAGDRLLSADDGGLICLWELPGGKCAAEISPPDGVAAAAVSPEGSHAVYCGSENVIRLWHVAANKVIRTFEGHQARINSLSFGGRGRYLVSGGEDLAINLWHLPTGRLVKSFTGHRREINSVCLSDDGRAIVSGASDETVKMWQVRTGRCVRTFDDLETWVQSVSLSGSGKYAAAGGLGGLLVLLQTDLERLNYRAPMLLSRISSAEVHYQAAEQYQGHLDQARQALETEAWEEAAQILRDARAIPGYERREDGFGLWAGLYARLPRTAIAGGWESGSMVGHEADVTALASTPDGNRLISASTDGSIRAWDAETCEAIRSIEAHKGPVNSVGLSPDGRTAASVGEDGRLLIWDLPSGERLTVIDGQEGGAEAVSFSPDGRFILTAGEDRKIRRWEAPLGRPAGVWPGQLSEVGSLAYSPEGSLAASGGGSPVGEHSVIHIWNAADGQRLQVLEGHTRPVNALAFTPDGRLASASSDGTIRLWDVEKGECLGVMTGHQGAVFSLGLSCDGRFAVTGGLDGWVMVWDLGRRVCLRKFKAHADLVTGVSLSVDGLRLFSAGADKAIKRWTLDWDLGSGRDSGWPEAAQPCLDVFRALLTERQQSGLAPESGDPLRSLFLHRLKCSGFGWVGDQALERALAGGQAPKAEREAEVPPGPAQKEAKKSGGLLSYLLGRFKR